MRLIAKLISILHAKFYCNRLTTAQDIQDYNESHFSHTLYVINKITNIRRLAELGVCPANAGIKSAQPSATCDKSK